MSRSEVSRTSPTAQRIAVAVSGSGRSLANFLKVQKSGVGFEVAAVIASRQDCYAVSIAKEHNLPVFVGSFKRDHLPMLGKALYEWLEELGITWVALAGFLRPFPVDAAWQGRVVNIHPALLPKFGGYGMYGDHVHQAVLDQRETQSGATVHFVTEEYDEGTILAQITVPVDMDDDVATLAKRVFQAECKLYPEVMDRLIRGELPLPNGQVLRLTHGKS